MLNLWTPQNLRALQLVIDEHKLPREASKEVGISYHAIFTLLGRARLKYFFLYKDPILIREIRSDARRMLWVDFKTKWKKRHIYLPIVKDIYIRSPESLDQIAKFSKAIELGIKGFFPEGKSKVTIMWRCPKCQRVQQVQLNHMVCALC
jgi:hypothetical protein